MQINLRSQMIVQVYWLTTDDLDMSCQIKTTHAMASPTMSTYYLYLFCKTIAKVYRFQQYFDFLRIIVNWKVSTAVLTHVITVTS